MTNDAVAVLISDIHFNVKTITSASIALNLAFTRALELRIPLIITGDLNDTKSIIRGEVANILVKIFKSWSGKLVESPTILIGNHDRLNEAGKEHSLNFLSPWARIVNEPLVGGNFYFIPYCSTNQEFKEAIAKTPKDTIVITHQGYKGAFMGEYVQDKSSVDPMELSGLKIFSGHYHRHQSVGPVTYVGSPYTTSFGEANDGPKGFLTIDAHGGYEHVTVALPRHVVVCGVLLDQGVLELSMQEQFTEHDRLWVKIYGSTINLKGLTKKHIEDSLGRKDFKLDLIPTDEVLQDIDIIDKTNEQIVDELIDNLKITSHNKEELKQLWRQLANEDT